MEGSADKWKHLFKLVTEMAYCRSKNGIMKSRGYPMSRNVNQSMVSISLFI
jgi:hypothetical protein